MRVMIIDGKYILQKGRSGDKPASKFIGKIGSKENIPDYVLLYQNDQIGAIHGGASCIFHIEIFDRYQCQGHGTKFIELMEKEAKMLGLDQIEVSPVTVDKLRHILEKRGFKPNSKKEEYKKKL